MPDTQTMTVVEQFAAEHFVLAGLTPGRQDDVLRALRALEAHAGQPPEQLDDRALRSFMADLIAGGMHVNTVRKYLNAIKPFYRWAWRERIVPAEQFMRVRDVSPPRGSTPNTTPRPYATAELKRFWSDLDDRWPQTTPLKLRRFQKGTSPYRSVWRHAMRLQTQAVVSLALFGGLRNHEIRAAGMEDIHPDNDFIVVRHAKSSFGEGNGYREVPYTEHGRALVGEWLRFRDLLLRPAHEEPWLVLTANASPNGRIPSHPLNPISDDGWKNLLPAIGAWELHRFRHTAATEWLRAGVALEKVSRLLGHANITQTLGYTELVRDDVARDVRAAEQSFVKAVGRRFNELGLELPHTTREDG